MNVSSSLCSAFELSIVSANAPADECAICGQRTAESVSVKSLIKSATGNIPDTFRGRHACLPCATAFGESRLLTGSLLILHGEGLRPMVSKESALKEGRPCWRDLIFGMVLETSTIAVITSNTKRRLWTQAVVSTVGKTWRPLFVDGDTDRLLTVSIMRLRECLDLIEQVYALGFSKQVIAVSLWTGLAPKTLLVIGMERITQFESVLSAWRGTDEFILALFVAQKEATS